MVRAYGNAFDFGVWVANCEVVEVEHAVEGLGEELELRLYRQFTLHQLFLYSTRTKTYPVIKIASPR